MWPRVAASAVMAFMAVACAGGDDGPPDGGPLADVWTGKPLVQNMATNTKPGEEISFGFRALTNPTADPITITAIEVEEVRGMEVIDIVAYPPEPSRRGSQVGVLTGFPPKIDPYGEREIVPLDGATLDPVGHMPKASDPEWWWTMVGFKITGDYGAARNIIVEYEWDGDEYTIRLPYLFTASQQGHDPFSRVDMETLVNTPIDDWKVWDRL